MPHIRSSWSKLSPAPSSLSAGQVRVVVSRAFFFFFPCNMGGKRKKTLLTTAGQRAGKNTTDSK